MGLLATLGLTPTASMFPAMGRLAASAAEPAPQNDWAEAKAANPPKELPTPYGPYFYDRLDEAAIVPAVEAALASLPEARAAHAAVVKVTAQLMKAKKVVEAGPHSPEDIAADVTAHASSDAGLAADTVENSKNLNALLKDLLTAAHGDLVTTQAQWEIALASHEIASDRNEATALKDEVEKEKKRIDDTIKICSTILGLGMKGMKGEVKEVAVGLFELIVEAYHELNGRERLARAEKLETTARDAEMHNLAQAIANAHAQLEQAVTTMEALNTRAAEVKEDHQRQRERAAIAFDAGSKGKLKLTPLMKALRGAATLNAVAADAAAKARTARRAGGDLARATPAGNANAAECRLVVDRMLKETRGWQESAEQTMQRCERLTAHWQSLCDAALAAMTGASGRGQSIDAALAFN